MHIRKSLYISFNELLGDCCDDFIGELMAGVKLTRMGPIHPLDSISGWVANSRIQPTQRGETGGFVGRKGPKSKGDIQIQMNMDQSVIYTLRIRCSYLTGRGLHTLPVELQDGLSVV